MLILKYLHTIALLQEEVAALQAETVMLQMALEVAAAEQQTLLLERKVGGFAAENTTG